MAGVLSFTAALMLVLVGGSSFPSSASAASTSFTITDSVYLTYTTTAQRDVFLQQALVIWRNTLSSLYQATDVSINFVNERLVGSTELTSTGSSRMMVTYRIGGKSGQQIDLSEAKASFRQSLMDAHLAGVEATSTTMTTDRLDTEDTDSSLVDTPSNPSSRFSFNDQVLMTPSSAAERDVLLQQIQLVWQITLRNLYQATGVTVTFIRERTVTTMSGSSSSEVTFRVSGTSRSSVSVSEARAAFRRSFSGSPIAGIELTETSTYTSSQNTDMEGPVSGPSNPSSTFSFTDRVLMTYATTAERDVLIQQIQQVWQNTLRDLYQATGVTVTFIRERVVTNLSGSSRNEVTFRVSGTSRPAVSVSEAKSAFRRSFTASPIAGIEITETTTYTSSQTTDTDGDGSVDTSVTSSRVVKTNKYTNNFNRPTTTSDTDSTVDVVPTSSKTFSFTDKLVMTYATAAQRDALLRQIQVIWQNTLSSLYQTTGVTVTFMSERTVTTSTGLSRKEVTFRVSGRSPMTVSIREAKSAFRQSLTDTPLSGVEFADSIYTTTDSDATMDTSSTSWKLFSFADSVVISLTIAADRNVVLPQIQTMWRTVLANLYQATGVSVIIVNDRVDSTRKEVQLKIAGRSPMTINVAEAKAAFRRSFMDSPITGVETVGTTTYTTSDNMDSTIYNPSVQPTLFSLVDTILMEYSTPAERNMFIKQIQNIWQATLSELYQATGVTITFLKERTVTTNAGLTRKEVQYRVQGRSPVTVNIAEGKSLFRQNLMDARLVGIDAMDKSSYAYTTITDSGMNSNSDMDLTDMPDSTYVVDSPRNPVNTNTKTFINRKGITVEDDDDDMDTPTFVRPSTVLSNMGGVPKSIEGNLLLAYSTREERDRDIGWIRRVWAYVFDTEVNNVDVTITRDILLPAGYMSSKKQAHNVTYVVTHGAAPSNFQASYYKRQFEQVLPASTTSYLVTFPQGDMPDSLNLTIIDQIRGPGAPSVDLVDQDAVKTFMIYDTITFSYTSVTERNRVLEIIRRAWETAFGNTAMNVDLVVHQDILNTDGTHQFSYVITVLSTQMDWNVQQLERKVRQVLTNANIPSLVAWDNTVQGSTQPFPDNGVRSYVFYDTVTMTYSTDAQKTDAIETLRKTWQQVFGSDMWNVQVSVYDDKPVQTTTTNAHRVSYSIMFSSMKTNWNFDTLERQFLSLLPTSQTGTGYSFITVTTQGRAFDDAVDSDDSVDNVDSSFTDVSIEDRSAALPTTNYYKNKNYKTNSYTTSSNSKTVFDDNSMNHVATKHYFLSDAIQMEYSTVSQRDEALEEIRSMWADLLGSAAYSVEISVMDDFLLSGSQKHDIHYSILVESSRVDLDLKSYATRFWSMLTKSDNVALQSAIHLIVQPYVQGTTNWNAQRIAQTAGKVVKKGSVSCNTRAPIHQTTNTYVKKTKTVKTVEKTDDIVDDNAAKVTTNQRVPYHQRNKSTYNTIRTAPVRVNTYVAPRPVYRPAVNNVYVKKPTQSTYHNTHRVDTTVTDNVSDNVDVVDTAPVNNYHYTAPIARPSVKVNNAKPVVPYYERNKSSQTNTLINDNVDDSTIVQNTKKTMKTHVVKNVESTEDNMDAADMVTARPYRTTSARPATPKIFFNRDHVMSPYHSRDTIAVNRPQSVYTKKDSKYTTNTASVTGDNTADNVDTSDQSSTTNGETSASKKSTTYLTTGANRMNNFNKNQNTQVDTVGFGQGADFVRGHGREHGHGHGGRRDDVEIRGSLTIRYSSRRERRSILSDIENIWLASSTLSDLDEVRIAFSSDSDRSQDGWDRDDVHTVTYTITGTSRRQFDEDDIRRALIRELKRAGVSYLARDNMRAL